MSLGYAERLSHREDLGGRLGDPELHEPPHVVWDKAAALAEHIRGAERVIAFTGAGISTRKGLPLPKLATSFVYAKPSLTHQVLVGLLAAGRLTYVCSQNVDSLHLRSGVPREQLAELHGNCFAERCKKCKVEYVRDFEMDTVGFKPTGRRCTRGGCRGQLVDHILDWEDALPPAELKATQEHASAANLALCLGTSLQIIPAANLPLRTVRAGGRLGIINLQATPKDKRADVVIHAKVDEVMAVVMQQLGVAIPPFVRTDCVLLSHTLTAGAGGAKQQQRQRQEGGAGDGADGGADGGGGAASSAGECGGSSWGFTLTIASLHGPACPLPMVASASVAFEGPAAGVLKGRELSGALPWKLSRTCPAELESVAVRVTLQLVDAADEDKRTQQATYAIARPQGPPAAKPAAATRRAAAAAAPDGSYEFAFVTQRHDYAPRQAELVAQLAAAAEASRAAAPAPAPGAEPAGGGGGAAAAGSAQGEEGGDDGDDDDDEEDDEDEESGSEGSGSGGSGSGSGSGSDAGGDAGDDDSDYLGSDASELAGQARRGGGGRPRKRARPLAA
ncbi:SRT1 [Scenedesmus sp. PABB004]|nr:SRT1 [Scenedesmus sp. PABB004]